jgi:hypothetical protein
MRRLLYLAALVMFLTALVAGLTLRSNDYGGGKCGPEDSFFCVDSPRNVDHRIPLRAGIIGGGLIAALLIVTVGQKVRDPSAELEPAPPDVP